MQIAAIFILGRVSSDIKSNRLIAFSTKHHPALIRVYPSPAIYLSDPGVPRGISLNIVIPRVDIARRVDLALGFNATRWIVTSGENGLESV